MLADKLDKQSIQLDAQLDGRDEVIHVLAGLLRDVDEERIVEGVLARESLGATGIGHGVAVPHMRCEGFGACRVSAVRLQEPIRFGDAPEPVQLLFLVVSDPAEPAAHLQALARIARLVQDDALCAALMQASTPDAFWQVVDKADRDTA